MPITFTVIAGPHAGRTFSFDRHDTLLVGRAAEAHFSLPDDPYFSRMHFLVEVNPPLCRLTDLNSHNGTLVNGQKVRVADLRNGDEIRGGRTTLRVTTTVHAATLDLPAAEATGAAPRHTPHGAATLDDVPESFGDTTSPERPVTSGPGFPTIPGYRLLAEIGRGGMGIVYRGVCEADGAETAIKTIRPEVTPTPTAVARFLREAAILAELRHPHIVGYRASGEANGLLYFAMDFVPGADAASLIAAGPLAQGRAVGLVRQLLDALAYAHGKGIVHRDIKPANLLVTGTAGAETVRVADFGLARAYQASALSGLTLSGTVAGTPHFMPPEQVTDFRHARPPADQYSAAATLYHLLCGGFVHEGTGTADLFRKVLLDEPVPLRSRRPELPSGLATAIHKALARRPEDRYSDVAAFSQALRPFSST